MVSILYSKMLFQEQSSSPAVIDTQPVSVPLQTLSSGISSSKDFDFLQPVNSLKVRPSDEAVECCSKTNRPYVFLDHQKTVIFTMVEDLSSRSGLLYTFRNKENNVLGQVRFEIEENSCCTSYSYSIEKQSIQITSSGGFSMGSIVMHSLNHYEIKNGLGELIMELKPKFRFLSKSSYPISSNGVTLASIAHGLRSTSIHMKQEFTPIHKLLLCVLTFWLNILKQIEDSRASSNAA